MNGKHSLKLFLQHEHTFDTDRFGQDIDIYAMEGEDAYLLAQVKNAESYDFGGLPDDQWPSVHKKAKANAQLIVRAVNNEQRYRTALEAICELIKEGGFGWPQSALEIAASALSTEGGE